MEIVASGLRGRPNWLLLGLLTVSVAGHALILANITRLFHHHATEYIELEVRPEQKSVERNIPVPPRHNKPQKIVNEPSITSVRPIMVPSAIPHAKIPKLDPMPSPVAEPIGMPDRPEVRVPKIFSWAARPSPRKIANDQGLKASSLGASAYEYLAVVRMSIERHKKYPMVARKRHMEGRVKLRFLLDLNGKARSVMVVKGSGYRILDDAAVAAVKEASPFPPPPKGLFRGSVPLEITIVFQLM